MKVLNIVSHQSHYMCTPFFSELILFLTFILCTIAAEAAGTVVDGAAGGGTALLGVVLILLGELLHICSCCAGPYHLL